MPGQLQPSAETAWINTTRRDFHLTERSLVTRQLAFHQPNWIRIGKVKGQEQEQEEE